MTPELDRLMRIKVLEGALGLQENSFDLKDFELGSIRPEWVQLGSMAFSRLLMGNVARVMKNQDSGILDAEDLVLQGFYGFNTFVMKNNGKVLKNPFYSAGAYFSENILSGEMTPQRIAAGPLGKMLFNRALSVVSRTKKQSLGLDVNPEGEQKDIPDTKDTPHYVCQILLDQTPLGQEVRNFIQEAFDVDESRKGLSHLPTTARVMLKAFSGEYGGTPFIPKASHAYQLWTEETGVQMTLGGFHTRPFQKFWVLLAKALEERPDLQSKIQTSMLSEGIEVADFQPEQWFGGGGVERAGGGRKGKRRKNAWSVWYGIANPQEGWRNFTYKQLTGKDLTVSE